MNTININLLKKSAVLGLSCFGFLAQAENITLKSSVEVSNIEAPIEFLVAKENVKIATPSKKKKRSKDKEQGNIYNVELSIQDI